MFRRASKYYKTSQIYNIIILINDMKMFVVGSEEIESSKKKNKSYENQLNINEQTPN